MALKVFGKYRIDDKLGSGAYGSVFRAFDPVLQRAVAIKVLHSHLASDVACLQRFWQEAEAMAGVNHPGIVRIYEFGQREDDFYLVMQFLSGGTLARHLSRYPRGLPFDQIERHFRALCSALDEVHLRRVHPIVHRDLKPENLLFDDHQNLAIADFGIARIGGKTLGLTRTGAPLGTPCYMAPELWKAEPVSLQADLYALGCILYQMLTGRVPFKAESEHALAKLHCERDPKALLSFRPEVPAVWDVVVKALMQKLPALRPASAGEALQIWEHTWAAFPQSAPARVRPTRAAPALAHSAEALASYRAQVAEGNANGQNSLGEVYAKGLGGLAKNPAEAVRLFRLAVDQGHAAAQANLGIMYVRGEGGLVVDEREALRLFRLAAYQGNAVAQSYLGVMYQNARGGLQRDEREAVRQFRLAAVQGNATGLTGLGDAWRLGRGGRPKDDRKAVVLYRLAAAQGDPLGQSDLGAMYEKGRGGLRKDECEAARLHSLAAHQGNASAQVRLGLMHEEGRGGFAKDDRQAAHYYQLAADQGYSAGRARLGVMLAAGRGGLPKDEVEASRLFRLAADRGNSVARVGLANMYLFGHGGLPKDEHEAVRLYQLAAAKGDASGQLHFGLMYEQGLGGLPADAREAERFFRLAAEQGDATAQRKLAEIIESALPREHWCPAITS